MNNQELWYDYAKKYNLLSEAMQEAEVDLKLLIELLKAAIRLLKNT